MIQLEGFQVVLCPPGHSDKHLGDVVMYNIGDFIRAKNPASFNDVVEHVSDTTGLLDRTKIKLLFNDISRYSVSGSSIPKPPSPKAFPIIFPNSQNLQRGI